jgi:aspartyl-tRNA(Asn)/glutamyl-tRNA(Gln) amidotransferase subunit B
MDYETVIGLEVHVQLNTKSKIFCGCSTDFGSAPNTQTCPVCQGHPGVLPVFNEDVLRRAILAGFALNCQINSYSKFDRKNYFYPDLPKAYQITQFDLPICGKGYLNIAKSSGENKTIGITRIHMEEDAGKLIHSDVKGINESYVDLNRAGTPLLEIVSEPDMRDAEEAVLYLGKLRDTIKFLDISDVNMEEGSLRCDVNISLRPKGQKEFGTRNEIKNLNSFKSVIKAIEVEIERQGEILDNGGKIIQETRIFDADKNETRSMRSKEEANDYRYFPDPDLTPIILDESYLAGLKAAMPDSPEVIEKRFIEIYGIKHEDAKILISEKEYAVYFEQAVKNNPKFAQRICNFFLSDILGEIKEKNILVSQLLLKPEELFKIFQLIDGGTLSLKIVKENLGELVDTGISIEALIEKKGLRQISDTTELEKVIDSLLASNPSIIEQFKAGKTKIVGSLVGMVMKETKGKANPQLVNQLINDKMAKL